MLNIKQIKSKDIIEKAWTGGTTKQVFIYPENADYLQRNFDWRISSARVESETSDFSPLVGYDRLLMV